MQVAKLSLTALQYGWKAEAILQALLEEDRYPERPYRRCPDSAPGGPHMGSISCP